MRIRKKDNNATFFNPPQTLIQLKLQLVNSTISCSGKNNSAQTRMEIRMNRQDGLHGDVKPCFPSFLCVCNFVSTLNFAFSEDPASAPLSCSRSSCPPPPRYKNNKLCLVLLDPRGLTQIKSAVAVTSAIRGQAQCGVWVNWCACVIYRRQRRNKSNSDIPNISHSN